eukprot:388492_1
MVLYIFYFDVNLISYRHIHIQLDLLEMSYDLNLHHNHNLLFLLELLSKYNHILVDNFDIPLLNFLHNITVTALPLLDLDSPAAITQLQSIAGVSTINGIENNKMLHM